MTLAIAEPLSELRLSDDIVLPLQAATETFAFIAMRRVGKSNAAVVMASQMYLAGIPWVCIDPKGDWWGIRSSIDGHGAGLSVTVFGGKHGDRPLLPDAGAFMADLIVRLRLTCILDVSEFTQAEKIRFLLAFATRLLQVNEEVLHLFFEECDDYIPQNLIGKSGGDEDETKLVRAFSRLIRQGGFKGIGATLITQRAALVSKNVLAQVDTFIALRTVEPLDIKVVWNRLAGHPLQKEITHSLPSLPAGVAWIISPAFLELYARTTFHRRTTFDSGQTPKLGEKRVIPTKLAEVELDKITAAMTSIIEQAELTDPDKLGKKLVEQKAIIERLEHDIAELRKPGKVATPPPPPPPPPPPEPEVEVFVVEWVPEEITAVIEELRAGMQIVQDTVGTGTLLATTLLNRVANINENPVRTRTFERREPTPPSAPRARKPASPSASSTPLPRPSQPSRRRGKVPPPPDAPPGANPHVALKAGARRMLETLARMYPMKLNRRQLGMLARVASKGGTFGDYLSVLRTNGLIVEPDPPNGPVLITTAGFEAAGVQPAAPLTSPEIIAMYQERLKAGARRMLDELIKVWPDGLTPDEVGARADVTVAGGTFGDYLSVLRTNGLTRETKSGRAVDEVFADGETLQLR